MGERKRGRTPMISYQDALELKKQHKESGLKLKDFCQKHGHVYARVWGTFKRYSLIQPRAYTKRQAQAPTS